jgi:UDP-3-O-[3-hydroxymyristoyl] N-acetylglucosamine deacetylase
MKINFKGECLSGNYSAVQLAPSDRFALFIHEDSRRPVNIRLGIDNINVHNHAYPHPSPHQRGAGKRRGCFVSLGREPKVDVVEHLFSALYGLDIFNIKIDLFGDEIPFFDGSSQTFVQSLEKFRGQSPSESIRLNREVRVENESSFIVYEPLHEEKFVIEMELSHPFIPPQKIALEINHENYIKEIAPARTFVFTDEDDPRLENLPPYGIGITKTNIYSAEPLRFSDELVRHKILDLLGDLFVLRKKISGKIVAKNTSHLLNFEFVTQYLTNSEKHITS